MSILQFAKHFQLIFDNSNVSKLKTNKTKNFFCKFVRILKFFFPYPSERSHFGMPLSENGELFSCNYFRIIQSYFLILLKEAILESKVASTNRNSSALLLHPSKIFLQRYVVIHFFINFFGTNFRHQNIKQCYWNNRLFCLPAVKKKNIAYIVICVWTLKILFSNKRILT